MSILLRAKTVRSIPHCLQILGSSAVPAALAATQAKRRYISKNILNLFMDNSFLNEHALQHQRPRS
jgi:stage V sporulation protein SpoVS